MLFAYVVCCSGCFGYVAGWWLGFVVFGGSCLGVVLFWSAVGFGVCLGLLLLCVLVCVCLFSLRFCCGLLFGIRAVDSLYCWWVLLGVLWLVLVDCLIVL